MELYPWYDIVDGGTPLAQGDFLRNCPILIPASAPQQSGLSINTQVHTYDVVVMSQSCDLAFNKLDIVLLCPFWPLPAFENRNDFFKSRRGKEALREGNVPGYHLLNKCEIEGFETDYLVVDFRNVYGMPFEFLKQFAQEQGRRLRLLPPYREHLSQAFARFFMRVGLPVDIPHFT